VPSNVSGTARDRVADRARALVELCGARRGAPRAWQPALAGTLVAFLALVAVFNGYIYFREVRDFEDRLHRRELMDNVATSIGPGRMVYLVYQPNRGDFIEIDSDTERFAAWGQTGAGREEGSYIRTPYAD